MRLAAALILLTLASGVAASGAAAQELLPPQIRVHTRADGVTHVYHTLALRPGARALVTRESGGEVDTLAVTRAAATAVEFAGTVGDEMEALMAVTRDSTLARAFFSARQRPAVSRVLTYLYPSVAEGLGRLAYDRETAAGETVTYRVQAITDLGRPEGDALEETVTIRPLAPAPPPTLTAERGGAAATLAWTYPESETDGVIQFHLYRVTGGERLRLREDRVQIRINNRGEYVARVEIPEEEAGAFVVTALDVAGQESAPSPEAAVGAGDGFPPLPVSGVSAAEVEPGEVLVTWPVSTETGAAGYHVYRARGAAGPFEKLTDRPLAFLETLYEDAPPEGQSWFYAVSVVDLAGQEGEKSGVALVNVEDRTPPPAPTGLVATPGEDGTVALAWAHDSPADFLAFEVYRRRTDRTQADVRLGDADLRQRRFVDTGETGALQTGAFYRYAVVALDSVRNVSDSATVFLQLPDVTPPAPPTALAAALNAVPHALLRWDPPLDLDLGSFRLVRDGAEIARLPRVRRTYRDTSVVVGREYRYTVVAVDTLGNASAPSEPLALRIADPDPPREVINLRAEATAGGVRLTWPAVPADDLAGYRVEGSGIATGVFETVVQAVDGTETTVSARAGPWFRVVAVDASGNESAPSRAVRAE